MMLKGPPKLVDNPELPGAVSHDGESPKETVLRREETLVEDFLARANFLGRVFAELRRRSESSAFFSIRNDFIYNTVIFSYDMLVTDFSSWCKRATDPGGLFAQLGNLLSNLRRARPADMSPSEPLICQTPYSTPEIDQVVLDCLNEVERERLAKYINGHFDFLFPHVVQRAERQAQARDIEELKSRFKTMARGVKGDRDNFRAHRYDGRKNANYPRLALAAVRKKIREMVKMMQAFRVVLMDGQHKMYNQPHSDQRRAAQDIADLIMHGSMPRIVFELGIAAGEDAANTLWQYDEARKDYYSKRRRAREARSQTRSPSR